MKKKKLSYQEKHKERFQEALKTIKNAEHIVLLSHLRPDEDALASQLALCEFLADQLKMEHVDIVADPRMNDRSDFLPHFHVIQNKEDLSEYDLIITLDTAESTIVYPENAVEVRDKDKQTVMNFDHHQQENRKPFGEMSIVEPEVSSTCQLLYYFLKESGARITKNIATCLMAGIVYDTGKFQHSNTTPEVLQISSELLRRGAPLTKITNAIFNRRSLATLQLWGRAFARVKVNPKTGMAVSVITKQDLDETGANIEDLSGLITIINSIENSRFSLLLTQEAADKIKGSLRSEEYKGVDVERIARLFGGGGHKLASGFTVAGELTRDDHAQWQIK